jgi:hypothetical protein
LVDITVFIKHMLSHPPTLTTLLVICGARFARKPVAAVVATSASSVLFPWPHADPAEIMPAFWAAAGHMITAVALLDAGLTARALLRVRQQPE